MKTAITLLAVLLTGLSGFAQDPGIRYNIVAGSNFDITNEEWSYPVQVNGYLTVRDDNITVVIEQANINFTRRTEVVTPATTTIDGYTYVEFIDTSQVSYMYVRDPSGGEELWVRSVNGISKFYLKPVVTQPLSNNYGLE